ncbi:hypothetical protein [Actinomadura viridis]|uniref:Peptidase inhibitor family I36 n=1 Tax=Actinomadura viridis TaxID=58110 RepID=A0A931DGI0_9ACTN|nr:hypothetical protein [Actinomadura viridis]MBG6089650.1 hypothetical protein [Actinomadura viridis]
MSANSTTAKLGTVGAVIASTVLALAAPAAAAGPTSTETATHPHCVADMGSTSMTCFTTEREADTFGNASQVTAAWQVHVILYDAFGYSGASIRLGSEGRCSSSTSDVDGVQPNLGRFGWSNRASSFLTRNNCDMKAWDLTSYGGDHFATYRDHDDRLTGMNNRISSFKTS